MSHDQRVLVTDFARDQGGEKTVQYKVQDDAEAGSKMPPPPIPVPKTVQTGEGGGEEPEPPSIGESEKQGREKDVELARDEGGNEVKDVFDRFTKWEKVRIVAIVSYSAFIAPMTSSVFLPSIPQMSVDLNTTAAVINYTVCIFIATIGIAPLIWSPLSGFYGRRPVYLASMPIMVVSSIGVALSRTVGQIIATRILQGIGSSAVLAVGAGTVGDIYRPTERANAMGYYYTGVLIGPAFSPLIAGLFTEYTALTWRSTQYFLVGCAVVSVLLTFFFLPETHHPPIPHEILKAERGRKFVPYIFNPLSILGLFRWPNICAIAFVSSCVLLETYCFIVPLATAFKDAYGVTNVAISGCLYIANGGGNIIGARIAGPWADAVVKRYLKKRGYRRPEDRLRASLLGLGVLMPASSLAFGWLLQYAAGGIAPPLIMIVINGAAQMLVLTPLNTYAIDANQSRSAEVIAVNNFVRYMFSAAASAFVLPMADAIGWGWTMTFCTILLLISCGVMVATIRYGSIWREKADRKHGYNQHSADERYGASASATGSASGSTSKDDEASLGDQSSSHPELDDHDHDHDQGHEHEHTDRPGSLVALNPAPRRPAVERANSGSRGELPPVGEVLKRTVSLSGGSVHGGG